MTFAAVASAAIGAGASLYGASEASDAAQAATQAQVDEARYARQLREKMFWKQLEMTSPYRKVGARAINQLAKQLNYQPFTLAKFQADPGYAFRMAEGQKALERSAAARGGLLSGGTLKATERFGQDLASQEYGNAFERYLRERNARIGPLFDVARLGESAATGAAAQAGTYAQDVGALSQDIGTAKALGELGSANAWNKAISSYLGSEAGQSGINALGNLIGGGINRASTYLGGGGGLRNQLSDLGVF